MQRPNGRMQMREIIHVQLTNLRVAENKIIHETEQKLIPDRMFFRIGDVAEITGIKPYVLRFWEKEFSCLSPIKNASGQRIYRKSDVESVLLIKRLLYSERYSIEGAKNRIKELRKEGQLSEAKRSRGQLDEIKLKCVLEIKKGLTQIIAVCS